MIIVLDVNPVLSALIKDSTSRDIILKSELEFCFPEPALHKIRKYKDYIINKSDLSELEYLVILNILFQFIKIITEEEILNYWEKAKIIMEHIDPEDVLFIATALSQEESIIWSDDTHFDKQESVKILKTNEILKLLDNKEEL